MMKNTLILTAVSLALAACTVGPDYQRPDIDMPTGWRTAQAPAVSAMSLPEKWWTIFGDEQLNRLVEIALAENKDIKIAASRVDQYRAQFVITDANRYPSAGYQADGSRGRSMVNMGGAPMYPTTTTFQLGLGLSFELDLWGKYRRMSEAARADLLASEYARDTVRLSLIGAVAQNYFELRGLDAQLIVTRKTLDAMAESLKLQKRRFESGLTSEMEMQQAQTQYDSVASQIPGLESQIAQKENALSVLLGRNPGSIVRGLPIDKATVVPGIPAGLPSEMLARRPDIRQAEENLVSANARIGVAKAAYFPTISLTGLLGLASPDLSNLFQGSSRVWNYAGTLAGPLYAGGSIRAGVEQATAAQQEMVLVYQQAIQSAFREVDDALIGYQKLNEQYEAQRKQYASTKKLLDLTETRYRHGLVSYLEVVDAQRNLYAIESSLVSTQQYRLTMLVALNTALGGGWVDFAPAEGGSAEGKGDKSTTPSG